MKYIVIQYKDLVDVTVVKYISHSKTTITTNTDAGKIWNIDIRKSSHRKQIVLVEINNYVPSCKI